MPAPDSSRRAFLSGLFSPLKAVAQATEPKTAQESTEPGKDPEALANFVAIVQGRYCIASTGFCRTCIERCPVVGAIELDQGMPMVVADKCTGCRICHEVCPAPTNAILMVHAPKGAKPVRPPQEDPYAAE